MPTSTSTSANMASTSTTADNNTTDPLAGVDHIVVIDSGAQNIRIASIPYPFPLDSISAATSTSSPSIIDPSILAQTVAVDVFPNAIARTRTPHTIPSLPQSETSPTAPPAGTKTSMFVSSHIHSLLDDYAALHLRLPHQSGIVVDWAAQKTIWDHVLTNHLAKLPQVKGGGKKGKLLEGKAVIITEAYFNLDHSQHATELLLFEHYGAQAVWRTSPATLAALGTDVFRDDLPLSSRARADEVEGGQTAAEQPSSPADAAEAPTEQTTLKRPLRTPRASTSTSPATALPRMLPIPRPQALLVLDLGYSYCHAVPILDGVPHAPSIRRLELGGKMLINLLKETLSFQQLDMMDESWLMSHVFARTSFVAAAVGARVVGNEKVERELEVVRRKAAAEWTYADLLLMVRYGDGGRRVGVKWSLPDYGGQAASGRAGQEKRDRARYGFVLDGPDPASYRATQEEHLLDWESSFIASSSSSSSSTPHHPPPSSSSSANDDDDDDMQTLTLTSERFSTVEHLFNPSALGLDQKPIPELILDSIRSVASTHRSAADMLWSNILLTGGLANTVNMRRRLANELRALAPADVPLRLWPAPVRAGDCSRIAISAGVVLACELSLSEALRADSAEAKVERPRKRVRKSRVDGAPARWLTYAQWAGAAEADVVRAANAVFYPTAAADAA
ncbi:related to ARP6-Actin-related protein [Sporisorium reilianum SRZ2]|uniref:Related to ARP6-Actin-related protein n=1 Tax=Sporisorium reilianum (strain SRZ2) TaxID=999809 RepID=E6ZM95_SPORE|nr:related to ARP6-Actin-related protein [Sporisorium reilianum SRZ2]